MGGCTNEVRRQLNLGMVTPMCGTARSEVARERDRERKRRARRIERGLSTLSRLVRGGDSTFAAWQRLAARALP